MSVTPEQVKARMPEIMAWVQANAARSDFAESLARYAKNKGALTLGQSVAVLNSIERVKLQADAPTVDTGKMEKVFGTALGNGLKRPALTIGSYRFNPAPVTGANPGAIYVKKDGAYLGKLLKGRFLAQMQGDHIQEVLRIAGDPLGEAIKHGKLTGHCAVCSRPLSDPDSVARGIGPICATKFGWS